MIVFIYLFLAYLYVRNLTGVSFEPRMTFIISIVTVSIWKFANKVISTSQRQREILSFEMKCNVSLMITYAIEPVDIHREEI